MGAKVLVLGGTGMLGQAVTRILASQAGLTVHAAQNREQREPFYLEVTTGNLWSESLFEKEQYDYVVNCMGVLKSVVDTHTPESLESAIIVNAAFPHLLSRKLGTTGARIINISTDGVFLGNTRKVYVEDSPLDCTDLYGKTKALGESPAENVLNIRCSIIGRNASEKKGLVEWFLALQEGSRIKGFTDHLWNGVTTIQLADVCALIVRKGVFRALRNESPVHHFCPNPAISKYDLLCLLKSVSGKNVEIDAVPSDRGPLRRILGTKYHELKKHYPSRTDWLPLLRDLLINSQDTQ